LNATPANKVADNLRVAIEKQKKIITELADWIDEDYQTQGWTSDAPGKLLIKRAREAVK
jgi:hypothetical protein